MLGVRSLVRVPEGQVRGRLARIGLVLLLLQATLSVVLLRWLVAMHLVEAVRPAAAFSVVAVLGLTAGLWALGRARSLRAHRIAAAVLVVSGLASVPFVAVPVSFRLLDARLFWGGWGIPSAQVLPKGYSLGTVRSRLYTGGWDQGPLVMFETEGVQWLSLGMRALASHTPHLSSIAFDGSGCRVLWLRLEPDLRAVFTVLIGRTEGPSRYAEESWPARLFWLDTCKGNGRPSATALTVPGLETRLASVAGQFAVAHSESRAWVFDLEAQELRAEYELPRDELSAWITSQTVIGDENGLTMVRKQYMESLLETLELDLDTHSLRRVSLIDFGAQPKSGFDRAEGDLLAIGPLMESVIVRKRHWGPGVTEGDFEIYGLDEGKVLFVVDGSDMSDATATYLSNGQMALAGNLRRRRTGVLRLVSPSGDVLTTREWPRTGRFGVLWETTQGDLLVRNRGDNLRELRLELLDSATLETLEMQSVSGDYFIVGRTVSGMLVSNGKEILEIDENLSRKVPLAGT